MIRAAGAVLLFVAVGCSKPAPVHRSEQPRAGRDYEVPVQALYADDPGYAARWPVEYRVRVCEGLTQDLQREALDLGAQMGAPYFADQVEWSWPTAAAVSALPMGVRLSAFTPGVPAPIAAPEIEAHWRQWLAPFRFLERSTLKIKPATVSPGGGLLATVMFEFAGLERSGDWRRDSGSASVGFEKTSGGWKIVRFAVTALETQRSSSKLFEDVTLAWLASVPASVRTDLLQGSASDEIHRRLLAEVNPLPTTLDHLQPVAMDAHPGVVVVDINHDGFDDLFVWDVLGTSVLLENQAGHGFVDKTAEHGLGFEGVSAAAFADLDSDGELDLVLGRWFAPSQIFLGHQGRFFPARAGRFEPLPANVVTVSLADVDADGRLDIFLGTAAHDFHARVVALMENGEAFAHTVAPSELALLTAALPTARAARAEGKLDPNVYEIGPANVLLMNRGDGHFVDETAERGLTLFRSTLEAAFADADGDGFPDLFLANDFAPANLYLNRKGHFEDVSVQSGADHIFFAMGASWGDFDGDGDLDLFASAMQSSAGNRIMSDEKNFSTGHDAAARLARKQAARGNTLLRNDGKGHFSDATAEPALASLRNAQWAYSGQFVDGDGDGWLDLFVPNGFFTSATSADPTCVRDL